MIGEQQAVSITRDFPLSGTTIELNCVFEHKHLYLVRFIYGIDSDFLNKDSCLHSEHIIY